MKNKILGKYNREELLETLKKNVGEKRFIHILGVEKMAVELAEIYSVDKARCRTSALYHDFTKFYSLEKNFEVLDKYEHEVDEIEETTVSLLHAKTGALLAKYEFGVEDEDVINAIYYHTTGRPNMSLIEKIIFVADAVEEGRKYEGVEYFRNLARENLDRAVLEVSDSQIEDLVKKRKLIHPNTVNSRNYLLKIVSNEL